MPDIDIDFVDRDSALDLFRHIRASRIDSGQMVKHNTGVYFHAVPVNAEANVCAVPYDQAEDGIRDLIVTGVQTCALPILILT